MRSMGGGDTLYIAIVGILATLATAIMFGLLNGFCVGYLKMPPFIVTLATMSLARGLALTVSNSTRIPVANRYFNYIGSVNISDKVPLTIVVVLIAYFIAHMLLSKTTFGRKTYAVGDNPQASTISGINVQKHTLLVYIYSSVFVALAAMVIVGRAQSAQPLAGNNMEFDAITAVVIGGTSLVGGRGNLKGTLLGVILTSLIFTGLSMMAIMPYLNFLIMGGLILLAVLSGRMFSGTSVKKTSRGQKDAAGSQTGDGTSHSKAEKLVSSGNQTVLSLQNISKTFPGVQALEDVSLEVKRGTVHALCGENGAGKSTLMKILSGVYQKDDGNILIDGIPVRIRTPYDAEQLGIACIYQELSNVPELNISQNINLGHELNLKPGILLDIHRMNEKANALLSRFNLNLSVSRKLRQLTVGQQQMVEIAKAYATNAWVVIMDEPTSSITEVDKQNLFNIIRELKQNNIAVIYISHKLSEIFEIADEVTILRDGRHVITGPVNNFDINAVIRHMVGRELNNIFDREKTKATDEVVLRVENLERKGVFKPISFEVRKGEVLGFSGLIGAGRTEVMRCVFGLDKPDSGNIYLNGELIQIRNPMDALESGIAMVSEDRRGEGIVPHLSVAANTTLATLKSISQYGWISDKKEIDTAQHFIDSLDIKTPSPRQEMQNLSGGNQQKVCLAKGLNCQPKVIILDEPTRGIDVGAKAEIHKMIDRLTAEGISIIMISSEMAEIIGASDRVIVLYEGAVTGEFDSIDQFEQEALMQCAVGIPKSA